MKHITKTEIIRIVKENFDKIVSVYKKLKGKNRKQIERHLEKLILESSEKEENPS